MANGGTHKPESQPKAAETEKKAAATKDEAKKK